MAFCIIEKVTDTAGTSMPYYHSHKHHEIYFLIDGERLIYTENDYYNLNHKAIIFFPPNTLHKTEGKTFVRININVDEEYLDSFQKEILHTYAQQIIQIENDESAELLRILEEFKQIQESETPSNLKDYFIKICFSYLILAISKLKHFPKKATSLPNKNVSILAKKTIRYLIDNYSEKITLDDLAAQFFVSKAALCKAFKKATNKTIAAYLLTLRISKAKELLLTTNKNINEIAELCGFSSQNYFSLIFKQKEKMSPLNYKKYCLT